MTCKHVYLMRDNFLGAEQCMACLKFISQAHWEHDQVERECLTCSKRFVGLVAFEKHWSKVHAEENSKAEKICGECGLSEAFVDSALEADARVSKLEALVRTRDVPCSRHPNGAKAGCDACKVELLDGPALIAQTVLQEQLLNDLQQILNVLDNKERTNPVRFAAIRFHASHALHQLRRATDTAPTETKDTCEQCDGYLQGDYVFEQGKKWHVGCSSLEPSEKAPAADPKTDALANFRLTLEIIAQRMTFDVHGGTVKDGWEIAAQYARNALAAFPADVTRPDAQQTQLKRYREALEQIRDFGWSDERVNVLRHLAREALKDGA